MQYLMMIDDEELEIIRELRSQKKIFSELENYEKFEEIKKKKSKKNEDDLKPFNANEAFINDMKKLSEFKLNEDLDDESSKFEFVMIDDIYKNKNH